MQNGGYPKFFEEFLKLQKPPTVSAPHDKNIIQPPKGKAVAEALDFEYIVAKKPKPRRVLKYLQGMIDDIVNEND